MEQAGYSVGPLVGEGASGKVRACKRGTQSMAVKIVSKKDCSKVQQKFLSREITSMGKMHHENIIKLHEMVETDSAYYIVMELAEKGDLFDKVMNNGLSAEEAKQAFREVVSAVQYCHESNIAHRDLKLENFLLTKSGQIKIADFGFSRTVEEQQDISQTFCGSTAYASPEILQGQAYDTKKADIWSLGVALYAMVSATLPFSEQNVRKMVEQQLTKNITFPKQIDSECKKLILSMLESNVNKRATLSDIVNSEYLN